MNKKMKMGLIVAVVVAVFVGLSFVRVFPRYYFGLCPGDDDSEHAVNGPVNCPKTANFWEWMGDDIRKGM